MVTGWSRGTPLWARQVNTPASETVTLAKVSTEPVCVTSTWTLEPGIHNNLDCGDEEKRSVRIPKWHLS